MMKPVSINTQKKIMYIPIVNLANMFIWLYNSIAFYKNVNTMPRTFITLILVVCPCYLINEYLIPNHPFFGRIVLTIYGYAVPVIISYQFIKFQKELIDRNKNKEI